MPSERMRHIKRETPYNYKKLRAFLIAKDLDPELAEALIYAPELLDLYPLDKLIVALAIINYNFGEERVTMKLQPIIYNSLKLEAYNGGVFIHAQMNDSLGSLLSPTIKTEILFQVKRAISTSVR